MYLDFVGDLDELYAACRIGYDVNALQGMALIAEIQRQDSLIGALQVDNMRLRGLIAEAVEDMGRGDTCVHAGLKGRMVLAMTPNCEGSGVTAGLPAGIPLEPLVGRF